MKEDNNSPVAAFYILATMLGAGANFIVNGWLGVLIVLAVSFGVAAVGIWYARTFE